MISNKNPNSVIMFDKSTGKLDMPTLLLKTRTGHTVGKLQYENLEISFVGKGMDTISFNVHKTVNGKECEFWDKIIDLCIVDYIGYGLFEADVNLTDEEEIIKTLTCKSLENELAQQKLREFHVNDEDDISLDSYSPTVLYNPNDTNHSLLHRVLKDKAPHWKIGYVSELFNVNDTVCYADKLQRTFTVNGTSIYDFLEGDVCEEFSCVFTYDTYNRIINCYNLEECVYNKSTMKVMPRWIEIQQEIYDNSSDTKDYELATENDDLILTENEESIIVEVNKYDKSVYRYVPAIVDENNRIVDSDLYAYCPGIGVDTNILVSKQKLSQSFSRDSDSESIKNCFYVTGGDEVINNYIGAANVTGNNYIMIFDKFQTDDMGEDLANALQDYSSMLDEKNAEFVADGGVYVYDPTCRYDDVTNCCLDANEKVLTTAKHIGNKVYVIDTYSYYKNGVCYTKDDGTYPYTDDSGNIIDAFYIDGGLYTKYAQLIDRIEYLEHTKFPNTSLPTTTALAQKTIVEDYFSENPIYTQYGCTSDAFDHVTNTIEAMVKALCDLRYDVKILTDSDNAPTCSTVDKDNPTGTWSGNIEITRTADEEDTTTFSLSLTVQKITDEENIEYCKQKMQITIAKMDIAELDFTKLSDEELRNLLREYNYNSIKSFATSFSNCSSTLNDVYNNLGIEDSDLDDVLVSDSLITSRDRYYKRYTIATEVLQEREDQLIELQGADGTGGEKSILEKQIDEFRKELDMKAFLDDRGDDFYNQFRSYIREDEYNNPNYVSNGSTTSEILYTCKELLEAAKKELSSACVIQNTISGDLNNIFALKELEKLHDNFALFNYVRARVDDKIYKLRLMEIKFNYQNPEKLDVVFSDQIECIDGSINDKQSILQSAATMATTYSSTVKQAKQGSVANKTFDDIRQEGLDSSLYLINNSPEHVMTFDRKGLLGRSMMDEGVYLDDQMILTANGLYFTTTAWQDVCTAIGKFKYNGEWVYGVNAKYLIGEFIIGENITAKNDNGSVEITGDGINITNGMIYIKDSRSANNTGISIEINPNGTSFTGHNDQYVFNVSKTTETNGVSSTDILMGIKNNGGGYFKGEIETGSGNIGGWNITETSLIKEDSEGNFICLKTDDKSIISKNGYNRSILSSGYLGISRTINGQDKNILKVRPTIWSDTEIPGAELASESTSKFISFGNRDKEGDYLVVTPTGTENPSEEKWYEKVDGQYILSQDTVIDSAKTYYKKNNYVTSLVLNYGLNPYGNTQDVQIYGTTCFNRESYFNHESYFNYNTTFNGGIYFGSDTCLLNYYIDTNNNPVGIFTNCNVGINGAGAEGYALTVNGASKFIDDIVIPTKYKGISFGSTDILLRSAGANAENVAFVYHDSTNDTNTFIIDIHTDEIHFNVDAYLGSSTAVTSDKDSKYDIHLLDREQSYNFVKSLLPSKFKYKSGNSGRFHHGFIAQQVREVMNDDWGVYLDTNPDAEGKKALRYEELIADLVCAIQYQAEEIKKLKEKMEVLF